MNCGKLISDGVVTGHEPARLHLGSATKMQTVYLNTHKQQVSYDTAKPKHAYYAHSSAMRDNIEDINSPRVAKKNGKWCASSPSKNLHPRWAVDSIVAEPLLHLAEYCIASTFRSYWGLHGAPPQTLVTSPIIFILPMVGAVDKTPMRMLIHTKVSKPPVST